MSGNARTSPGNPLRQPESSDFGGGSGLGSRSSSAEQNPVPGGTAPDAQEGTGRPRWTPPGGTQDIYHPWSTTGPQGAGGGTSGHLADGSAHISGQPTQPAADDGMWPQSRPSQQSGTSSPGGRNGISPVNSAGHQPEPVGCPIQSVAWRHGMTDPNLVVDSDCDDGPDASEDESMGGLEDVAEPDATKRDFDPNVGGGTDRDKLPDADFAGRGRSFPMVTQADVSDALQSIGRAGADNYSHQELRRRILDIAHRKGFRVPSEKAYSDVGIHPGPGSARPHLNYQVLAPVTGPTIISAANRDPKLNPLASAIQQNLGRAQLQILDQAEVSRHSSNLPRASGGAGIDRPAPHRSPNHPGAA